MSIVIIRFWLEYRAILPVVFSDIVVYDVKRTNQDHHNTDDLHRNHHASENQERQYFGQIP